VVTVRRRALVIGFRRWRAWNLGPILRATAGVVVFVRDVSAARALHPGPDDDVMVWGAAVPVGLADLIAHSGARLVRIEDGFIRSVGLGSDLIAPRSLVLDPCGIYFDATRASRLETLLATGPFDGALCARAAALRATIVARGLTKYNVEHAATPSWDNRGRPVVLVPGQVETDASIALGGGTVRTNRAVLQAARAARPDAFVVYKPHPDVITGNRRGRLAADARGLADHVETRASIIACLARTDAVHTMTSLAGFDALLRGIDVVTYGAPFYAGWGLTEDCATDHPAWARRGRHLTLDQLCAAALLVYPHYWDPDARCLVNAEPAIAAIASERDRLRNSAAPDRLIHGFWARQGRKARLLTRAWLGHGHRD
jgi:capsular polysaccharide export protein